METLKIITYPNKILKNKSKLIVKENILQFADLGPAMIKLMLDSNGVGLAAPQIGKNICLIVINKEVTPDDKDLILFNPKITFKSKETSILQEGCLSLPKIFQDIKRPDKIRVNALNEKGEKIQLKAKSFFSHVLQHEIDHLHGILIIDHV